VGRNVVDSIQSNRDESFPLLSIRDTGSRFAETRIVVHAVESSFRKSENIVVKVKGLVLVKGTIYLELPSIKQSSVKFRTEQENTASHKKGKKTEESPFAVK